MTSNIHNEYMRLAVVLDRHGASASTEDIIATARELILANRCLEDDDTADLPAIMARLRTILSPYGLVPTMVRSILFLSLPDGSRHEVPL